MTTATTRKPIQAAVFDTVEEAEDLIFKLRQAGFTSREISVVCSDPDKLKHFAKYVDQQPAGSNTEEAIETAGKVGLGLGTAAVATALVTTGGIGLFAIGAFAGIALVGTFAAAMMTRGAERELADYYDQSMTHGKLLVAIDTDDPARQETARQIFDAFQHPPQPLEHEV